MHGAIYLVPLIYLQYLAHALVISVPPGPILNGINIVVEWSAAESDPLAFNLGLLCEEKTTLNSHVERTGSTDVTGEVSYLIGCLGEHLVQALTVNGAVPFANSSSFQVVSSLPTQSSASATSSSSQVGTPLPTQSSSPGASTADLNRQIRTLVVASSVLGAALFFAILALIFMCVRDYRRTRHPPRSGAPEPFKVQLEDGDLRVVEVPQQQRTPSFQRVQEVSIKGRRLREETLISLPTEREETTVLLPAPSIAPPPSYR
ncbi:hypothetical protein C8R44DRAFT_979400 [Mycena epipterygia]|nr:hypothetical protein C8R44DRAFT_979400 [Mycena epipterygia]